MTTIPTAEIIANRLEPQELSEAEWAAAKERFRRHEERVFFESLREIYPVSSKGVASARHVTFAMLLERPSPWWRTIA